MYLALLLIACGPAQPLVTAVDPAQVVAGQPVKVIGENFGEGAAAGLVGSDGVEVALQAIELRGVVLLQGVVPEETAPGSYDLRVSVGSVSGVLAGGLLVVAPPRDNPCAGDYTANTQLSLARGEIVVDRFHRDGERETLRVPVREVERIEYELVKMSDEAGKLCSVIFVRTADGGRIMFDDDTEVDLKQRAYKMARDMGKPVEVTREDAREMGKPVEKN